MSRDQASSHQTISFSIKTEQLSKRFNREWIFKNFSFEFAPGKTYAITGPNGSGKSTLMQILWGQVPPTSGKISYVSQGRNVEPDHIFQHVAIATPYLDLIDEFTLQESLDFHFKLRKIKEGVRIPDLLDILYLKQARNKAIGKFSSGMKQRLKLGLAFYTQADVLFLDEPGTNLDQQAFDWYLGELKKVSLQTIKVIASNNPAEYPGDFDKIYLPDLK